MPSSTSSSASSTSSSYHRTHFIAPPPIMSLSSDEFARMIDRSNMDEVLTLTFQDDATITLNLHDFVFVSQSRRRLEQELQARIIEQQDLFGDLIRNRRFQRRASRFIAEYRRFQPYSRPASATSSLSTTSSSSSEDSDFPRRFSNVRNSVPGSPTNPIDVDSDIPLDGRDPSPVGSITNPINVDSDTPLDGRDPSPPTDAADRLLETFPGDRMLQEFIAQRNSDSWTAPRFRPTCERCGIIGHDTRDCDTPIRSFTHCDTCQWLGRRQRLCDHYDMSPADFNRLRGRIPYDHDE